MATFRSSWLVGSVRDLPEQVFEADGVAAVLPAGSYYLTNPVTADLSLLWAVRLALIAAGVSDANAYLSQSRQVVLEASEPFTVTWGSASRLRDLLGFTADLPNADEHLAPLPTPLVWSPARPMRSELSPIGTRGIARPLSYFAASPSDGSNSTITHGAREFQKLTALNIANDRIFTKDQKGGEYVRFFTEVLSTGASLYHFPGTGESATPTTNPVTLVGGLGLGPYTFSPSGRAASWVYDRSKGFEWTDSRQDIDISLHVVPEYPT